MKLLAIIFFLTVLEAVHEGLAMNGNITGRFRALPGIVEMFKLTGLVFIIIWAMNMQDYRTYLWYSHQKMFWGNFLPSLLFGWAFIRYAIFDFIHNACAGLPLTYVGKTKWFDQFFNWLLGEKFRTPYGFFFWWTRPIFLLVGLSLILKI